ncbi:MAG: GNAT family N-acetyltransferase [Planctomycetota bacterium]
MVDLQAMTEITFRAYLEKRIQRHAETLVKAGSCCLTEAIKQSRNACQSQFPEGLASKTNHLFSIIDGNLGTIVGNIWFRVNYEGPKPSAEIHDFLIYDEFRRKGYGRQAMTALENRFRELGIESVLLWLKPDNQAAQALCRKSGFNIVGTFMRKKLSAPTPHSTVRLEPMTKEVVRLYVEEQIQRHAELEARNSKCSLSDALEKARRDYEDEFPEGLASENNYPFSIIDAGLASPVGFIWFGMHHEGSGLTAFIEEFRINDELQRKGYGTQSLMALEHKVRELGGDTVSLFVQVHNQAAQRLYFRVGYNITGIETKKSLIASTSYTD